MICKKSRATASNRDDTREASFDQVSLLQSLLGFTTSTAQPMRLLIPTPQQVGLPLDSLPVIVWDLSDAWDRILTVRKIRVREFASHGIGTLNTENKRSSNVYQSARYKVRWRREFHWQAVTSPPSVQGSKAVGFESGWWWNDGIPRIRRLIGGFCHPSQTVCPRFLVVA